MTVILGYVLPMNPTFKLLFWFYDLFDLILSGGIPAMAVHIIKSIILYNQTSPVICGIKNLFEWTGTTNLLTITLVIVTCIYVRQVRNQTKIVAKQAEIMYENQIIDTTNKKYDRNLKEMEQLVAPLYSWICRGNLDAAIERINVCELERLQKNKYLAPKALHSKIDDYISTRGDWNTLPTKEKKKRCRCIKRFEN